MAGTQVYQSRITREQGCAWREHSEDERAEAIRRRAVNERR